MLNIDSVRSECVAENYTQEELLEYWRELGETISQLRGEIADLETSPRVKAYKAKQRMLAAALSERQAVGIVRREMRKSK